MIVCHLDRLELSLPVAKALLAFASDDATRPSLGVGIDARTVGATDGHAALRFDRECIREDGKTLHLHNGKAWTHEYVSTALKVARAKKAPSVELPFADAKSGFAPLERVFPDYEVDAHESIGFDPSYVAALATVGKACGQTNVELVAARAPLDPLMFRVVGVELSASMVLMPCRK